MQEDKEKDKVAKQATPLFNSLFLYREQALFY